MVEPGENGEVVSVIREMLQMLRHLVAASGGLWVKGGAVEAEISSHAEETLGGCVGGNCSGGFGDERFASNRFQSRKGQGDAGGMQKVTSGSIG